MGAKGSRLDWSTVGRPPTRSGDLGQGPRNAMDVNGVRPVYSVYLGRSLRCLWADAGSENMTISPIYSQVDAFDSNVFVTLQCCWCTPI